MNWLEDFILQNYLIICIALMLIISSVIRYKQHRNVSVYIILIMVLTLSLAVFGLLENYAKSLLNPDLTLIFAFLGYTIRPTCIFLLLLLSDDTIKGKFSFFAAIPLIINVIIYSLCFFPTTREYVVYFHLSEDGTALSFGGGYLRFASHIISAAYLAYLLFVSFSSLKFKRVSRGVVALACSSLVISSVIIETFFNPNGDIYLLNTAIATSVFIYYIYLNFELSELDETTGLYKGQIYNFKVDKLNKIVNGVIVFKINPPENDNDSKVVDEATVAVVAKNIIKLTSRRMSAFRADDDKIVLLVYRSRDDLTENLYNKFKEKDFIETYNVDIGYAVRSDSNEHTSDLVYKAERVMAYNKK